MQTVEREYFTPRMVSELTGIKLDHVIAWIHDGSLKASNTAKDPNGKRPRWRIALADLQAFMDSRANAPAEPIKPTRRRRTKAARQWV